MQTLILVVDDNRSALNIIAQELAEANFRVITSTNGEKALELIKRHHPKIVITETVLPTMDGYELLRIIQLQKAETRPIVFFLTHQTSDHSVFKGWQSGADAYLTKPYNLEELLGYIQNSISPQE